MTGNNPAFSNAADHEKVERNHGYHRPKYQETMDKMETLRQHFKEVGHTVVNLCPSSPERSRALDHLDDACMKAIASLARFEPEGDTPNTTSHPLPAGEWVGSDKPVDPQPYPLTPDAGQKS